MRDGSKRDKQSLTLADESQVSIEISLWGECCTTFTLQVGQIVALKSCRVSDYAGRSLNASGDVADIYIELDHPMSKRAKLALGNTAIDELKSNLRSLTTETGSGTSKVYLIEQLMSFAEKDPDIQSGKPFYCRLICEMTWLYIPLDVFERPMFYFACTACKRKVTE